MRWIAAILGVVIVAVIIVVATRSGGSNATSGMEPTGNESAAQSRAPGFGPADAPTEAERQALARLRAELSHAAPVAFRSDEQRLEEARAWVAANRPADRPYNELEARILALMDVLADGDKRSAEWTMNMSQVEVEMIRALDADHDGQVSDAEVQQFIDDNVTALFNPMEHPYLKEKFDTNGDGVVSPDEMTGFASAVTDGALAGAIERGKLEAWDTDKSGTLSADERAAGEEAVSKQVDDMLAQFMPDSAKNTLQPKSDAELATLDEQGRQQYEAGRAQLDAARNMIASQLAAKDLLEAMRLDNLQAPDPAEYMKSMPAPPDPTSFDSDGDGAMSEAESTAQMQAMADYQKAIQRWGAEQAAYRLKAQFDNATSQNDSDGDGRLSDAEWDGRINELLDEREQRLFLRSYDLDQSGRVDASELTAYLDWYRNGSLRADVNYDGTIDARDLSEMATRFQQQLR
ncbi:MAG: hypothetical protein IPJ41_01715 [Phycisphaerales bacterium]|nr:hypothetical protein [Phycisphaerales bacterium]